MNITKVINTDNVKKILKCCPYYDDIINYNINYDDEISFDLIDWYKDLIFSCNSDNIEEVNIIKQIDYSMYLYVNDYYYQRDLKKIITSGNIDLNSTRKTQKLIRKIINFTNRYEEKQILEIKSSKWL